MAELDCFEKETPMLSPQIVAASSTAIVQSAAGQERWTSTAAEVRRQLAVMAHCLEDSSVPRRVPAIAAGKRPTILGPHLYNGFSGMAIFFAAHYRVTNQPADRELALAVIAPLRLKIRQLTADPERAASLRLGVGGLVGVGSFLYAFTRLAAWLDDQELLTDAARCLSLITAERVAADDRFDVVSGCAGAILALLAFERETAIFGDPADGEIALAVAARCASRLLDARVSWQGRPRGWLGSDGRPPLSGFAHGAAGIAYALLRLYERTGGDAYRIAAAEAYAFERSLYLPHIDGWLDLRFDRPVEQSAWCHGTPGIALGRVGGLVVVNDAETQDEVRRTLETTLALPLMRRDHLCCGNACRIEILLTAALTLDRDDLAVAARRLANEVLDRAEVSGGFVVETAEDDAPPTFFFPSLFLGIAGVGYTFLRLAHPEALPCLLLMD